MRKLLRANVIAKKRKKKLSMRVVGYQQAFLRNEYNRASVVWLDIVNKTLEVWIKSIQFFIPFLL